MLPPSGATMERLREDLIRRARMERRPDGDLEQGPEEQAREPEVQAHGNSTTRPDLPSLLSRPVAAAFPRYFNRRGPENESQRAEQAQVPESPKSPEPGVQEPGELSGTNRFSLASISRFWPGGFHRGSTQTRPDPASETRPLSPQGDEPWGMPLPPPEPETHARMSFRAASSRYSTDHGLAAGGADPSPRGTRDDRRRRRHNGSDHTENHNNNKRRRRRHHRGATSNHTRARRHGEPPERFLYCFPWVKSRRARAYIIHCLVSGLILILLLTVYLSLSLGGMIDLGGFSIVLVLVVVLTTLFFCYGLMRLCVISLRNPRDDRNRVQGRLEQGYAVPVEPIRVVLARDEEAAGLENEVTKVTPPAYGAWRESVRVDPNLLFWQRNESMDQVDERERPGTSASRRPPSYMSDDGVSYVVHAEPRSIAPSMSSFSPSDLPLHPSEAGRVSLAQPQRHNYERALVA